MPKLPHRADLVAKNTPKESLLATAALFAGYRKALIFALETIPKRAQKFRAEIQENLDLCTYELDALLQELRDEGIHFNLSYMKDDML